MAIGESYTSLLDSSGAVCDKSDLVLDFGSMDQLLAPNLRASKGKNIAAIALAPRDSVSEVTSSHTLPVSDPQLVPVPEVKSAPEVPVSWASTVKAGNARHTLDYISPVFDGDASILQLPTSIVAAGLAAYKAGMFLFQFPTDASLSRALNGGPWHVNGIPLILRVWDSNIQKLDVSSPVLPVWVQLSNVPLELTTREGLSYLASAIGRPLHMDKDCSRMLKTDRVNICIDVDFAKPLLSKLLVNLDGVLCSIGVQYSWKPQLCDSCNQWGHDQLACSSNRPTAKQWIPKTTAVQSPPLPVVEHIALKTAASAPLQSASMPTQPIVAVSPKDVLSNAPLPSQIPKIPTVPAGANLNHSIACVTVSVASSSTTSPTNATIVPSPPNIPADVARNAPVASVGVV
ncbi:hypothetical protein Tsubulata_026162 [Turnera subulata]|uniref:DUF4283 domain-containing protein n=1 Tax=Turnera subulata TaxID=218843 RepID=A0A9Q0F4E8_9ROSI|nr:hypothetical protein Tsubulata_026162 [Turnera subulata]